MFPFSHQGFLGRPCLSGHGHRSGHRSWIGGILPVFLGRTWVDSHQKQLNLPATSQPHSRAFQIAFDSVETDLTGSFLGDNCQTTVFFSLGV